MGIGTKNAPVLPAARRMARAAAVLLCLLAVGPLPVRAAPAAAGSPGALASPEQPWARWQVSWDRLAAEGERERNTLAALGRIDSLRSVLEDSLCAWLAALPPPPAHPALEAWARERIRKGLIAGAPGYVALFTSTWTPASAAAWNADGAFSLPAALALAEDRRWADAIQWLEAPVLPEADTAYGASLLCETALAAGDTLRAGTAAESLLAARADWPEWTRADLEQSEILSRLAQGDTAAARRGLAAFARHEDRRGFWLIGTHRLGLLVRDQAMADSVAWRLARGYPAGGFARRLLQRLVGENGPVAPDLSAAQKRLLLGVCEARSDVGRFRAIEESLRPALSPEGRDSLAVRGAHLAIRARNPELLIAQEHSGAWYPRTRFSAAFALDVARAYRNAGYPDSMAVWYRRVALQGSPEDQANAWWEWAREMESRRRFSEADSLYGRFLGSSPGDRRAQGLIHRALCCFASRDWARAASYLSEAERVGDPEDREAAGFWLYRAALARGDRQGARAALARAAKGTEGYYGWRARSALSLSRRKRGPSIADVRGYWKEVARLGAEAGSARTLIPSREVVRPADGGAAPAAGRTGASAGRESWTPSPALEGLRDQLLLFRQYGRGDWALEARSELLDSSELGQGTQRVERLLRLGLPDLAARAAVKASLDNNWKYPLPFAAAVARTLHGVMIAPEWIWAVMRAESFYESSAVSPAGAVGLMQLMDGTARATAEKHDVASGPLRSPRVNLGLGVRHLQDLLDEEPEAWPVVIAAYNAGLVNAHRWEAEGDDPDLYIERIGYRETRGYVMNVLEGFWTYREMLGRAPWERP